MHAHIDTNTNTHTHTRSLSLSRALPLMLSCVCVPSDNHDKFSPSKSSTYRYDGKPLEIHYLTGSMTGVLACDTVTVRN